MHGRPPEASAPADSPARPHGWRADTGSRCPEDDHLPRPLARLTAREREVLDILATGATNRAIAGRLFITEKTVSVHVTNLMAKLDVSNRGEAAALARRLEPLD